jgi:DNA-binding protein HU-beta
MAGKALTQAQIADKLAKELDVSKAKVKEFFAAQTALAYKEAKNGFTIPGLGKLVLVARKARMGRNPATGEAIKIPAKKVVKFRVGKAAKDAIAPPKAAPKKAVKKKVAKKAVKKARR